MTGIDGGPIRLHWPTLGRPGDRITLEDVRWLCRYLGRIRDSQLHAALAVSGANDEAARFTRAIRERISQLVRAAA